MAEYTIKFKFSTIKVSRRSTISGANGGAECDITVDGLFDKTRRDQELVNICKRSIQGNPKVLKMGSIQSLEIVEIIDKI